MNFGRRQLLRGGAGDDSGEKMVSHSSLSSIYLKQNHLSARRHNGLPIKFHQAHLGNCHRITTGFYNIKPGK